MKKLEIGKSYKITHSLFGSYEVKIMNKLKRFIDCQLFGAVYHDSLQPTCISLRTINENSDMFVIEEIETIEIADNYKWNEV